MIFRAIQGKICVIYIYSILFSTCKKYRECLKRYGNFVSGCLDDSVLLPLLIFFCRQLYSASLFNENYIQNNHKNFFLAPFAKWEMQLTHTVHIALGALGVMRYINASSNVSLLESRLVYTKRNYTNTGEYSSNIQCIKYFLTLAI